jgi:mRNA degradation ribonuclease J1/J2
MTRISKKKNSPDHTLRIIPLGGLGEVGMNCMVIEHGDEAVIIDNTSSTTWSASAPSS